MGQQYAQHNEWIIVRLFLREQGLILAPGLLSGGPELQVLFSGEARWAMRQEGGGSILTLTSSSVKEPIDFLLLSNVMRSGVTSLAKSLSEQLAPENIRVNNLMPGRIDTDRVQALDQLKADARGQTVEEIRAANEFGIPLGGKMPRK